MHVALGRLEKDPGDFKLIEQLAAENPNVTYSHAPARRRRDGWRRIGWLVRALTDLSRYGDPRYADAPALRGRFVDKLDWRIDYSRLPKTLKGPLHQRVASLATGSDAELSRKTIARLSRYEDAIPPSRRITEFLAAEKPDAVLASPVIEFASSQVEYLKAARALGIRTGICVASWDNLTGKGLLRFVPDRVFVWNDIQRQELEEMHGIPGDRVVLTGAQRLRRLVRAAAEHEPRRSSSGKVALDPEQPVRPLPLLLAVHRTRRGRVRPPLARRRPRRGSRRSACSCAPTRRTPPSGWASTSASPTRSSGRPAASSPTQARRAPGTSTRSPTARASSASTPAA